MSIGLETQISLITVPQEFTRLCNAVLFEEYGDDFLPIDDDRPDRGNDGYLKSERRVFAAHCFKRAQNQSLDDDIRGKMLGDLGKAIVLRREGVWPIDAWTFLSNYPVPDHIAERVVKLGSEAGIDVAWRGPPYLAERVRRHGLEEAFPALHVTQIDAQLGQMREALERTIPEQATPETLDAPTAVPRTQDEIRALLLHRPPGWEYLLYAGFLLQGRDELEQKWHDEELGMPRGERLAVDADSALDYVGREVGRLRALVESVMRVFAEGAQERAFGAPGEVGDAVRIENLARHVVATYEAMLDWSAGLRAIVPPEEYQGIFSITASMAHTPIVQFREFVDEVVREMDRLPAYLEDPGPDPLTISVTLTLSLDDSVIDQFGEELRRVESILGN